MELFDGSEYEIPIEEQLVYMGDKPEVGYPPEDELFVVAQVIGQLSLANFGEV